MTNKKMHIEKNMVQETLLVPLYGRKMCAEMFPTLYTDSSAKELCDSLDYDFSALEKKKDSTFFEFGALEAAMRQLDIMWEVKEYLREHPKASVVNLGCGLDQTGKACDNGTCKKYNVDFPDTIEVRSQLLEVGEREVNIASDLKDIHVSTRGYMLGYYDMKSDGIRPIHRFLARVGDNRMKMAVHRMEFKPKLQ